MYLALHVRVLKICLHKETDFSRGLLREQPGRIPAPHESGRTLAAGTEEAELYELVHQIAACLCWSEVLLLLLATLAM